MSDINYILMGLRRCLGTNHLRCRPQVMVNELPTVMGMFSVTLTSGGSFEGAVRNISENGPRNIARLFRKAVRDADCRKEPDIRKGIDDMLSSLPVSLSEMKRTVKMVMAAFDSSDQVERRMMMDDAEDMALESLKEVGQTYSSGLSTPCMMIFGLGTMVPMMLISFFPILSMGGVFEVQSVDPLMLTVVTLVAIPVIVLTVIVMIRERDPFPMRAPEPKHLLYITPMMLSIPLYMFLSRDMGMTEAAVISAITSSVASLVLMFPSVTGETRRERQEVLLGDSLFALGNRLMMGDGFVESVVGALRNGKEGITLSDALDRESILCRGDIGAALLTVLSPISEEMAMHYLEVFRASRKDIRDAGRLAVSIAHQVQDRNSVRKDIGNRLRSMMDMMTGTASVFAPLIFGMSVVMLGPISDMAGTGITWDVTSVLVIYLIELAALMSVLSTNLTFKGGILAMETRFCTMLPVSLTVFSICTRIPI